MFDNLTISQMTTAHNAAQDLLGRDETSHVKKFADKKAGIARLERVRGELQAMHGQATLREDLSWDIETRTAESRAMLSTLDLSARLSVIVDINPKRPGSRAHQLFALYDGCATGADYVSKLVAAGCKRKLALSTLHWDIDRSFVRLGE